MPLYRRLSLATVCVATALASAQTPGSGAASGTPLTLNVDLTDAPRKILHASETIPVKPGPMTLVYPKWIPGEHGPTGPIDNQAGFVIKTPPTVDGKPGERVKWERDDVDMYSYRIVVPSGVTQLNVAMDFLATAPNTGFSAGASTSANLALLSWNSVVVYPAGMKASDVMVTASIQVPKGWKYGTALEQGTGGVMASIEGRMDTAFKTVSLEQLIDSPVLAGRWFREIPLATESKPDHFLDLAGDGPEDVELSQEHINEFSRLVRETGALYKSRHYGSYHFLVTLSDQVAHFGLEHHQSSDDRVPEKTFVDDNQFIAAGLLLPHEFTHSWNGKYRRPAGLATPNYQEPMKGELLWVYEGMTEYLGDVLAARCGIWPASVYRDRLATILGYLNDARPGRTWRDLQDTATMAQVLYNTGGAYDNWRRATDYYDEGELLWLEVDLTIREKTKGKKSLNDFAGAFEGLGGNTGPKVVPYTFEDVVSGLNAVVKNDWAAFLQQRLDANERHAPELTGINSLSGYKLTYTDKPNYWSQLYESQNSVVDTRFSLGVSLSADGHVTDVMEGGLADKAGFGPGMHVIAVNGRSFTPLLLRQSIKEAAVNKATALEFIVENTGYYRVIRMEYHEGEKYPQMESTGGKEPRLDAITEPMAN